MTVQIRFVEPSDRDAWAALFRGYREHYERTPDEAVVDTAWSWIQESKAGLFCLVAVDGERVIGIANANPVLEPWMAETSLHLHDLFVDPEARGLGAASALLARLAELARDRGWSGIEWVTDRTNDRARRVYDRVAEATEWVTYAMAPAPLNE